MATGIFSPVALVPLQTEVIGGKGIEVRHPRVQPQLGGGIGLAGQQFLHQGDVAVIDVGIGDDVDQLPRLQAGNLGQQVDQHRVLHHIPPVGGEHVLGPLVEDGVQGLPRDVKGHGVGAGVEGHLAQIVVVVQVGQNPPGGGVVLEIVEHPVHLVHVPLGVVVLHPQLVPIGLADGAGLIGPGIPDAAVQVVNVVGLLLPNPQQLIHSTFQVHPADGLDGKLLPEVVAVDQAEQLNGMGRGSILPPWADGQVRVPRTLGQDLPAVLLKKFIGFAHGFSSWVSWPKTWVSPAAVMVTVRIWL